MNVSVRLIVLDICEKKSGKFCLRFYCRFCFHRILRLVYYFVACSQYSCLMDVFSNLIDKLNKSVNNQKCVDFALCYLLGKYEGSTKIIVDGLSISLIIRLIWQTPEKSVIVRRTADCNLFSKVFYLVKLCFYTSV